MSQLSSLVAKGKPAVEAALSAIEKDIAASKAKASELAASLQAHVDSHQTEIDAAKTLLARAGAAIEASVSAADPPPAPPTSLSGSTLHSLLPSTLLGKLYARVGWRGIAGGAAGLVVLDYLHRSGHLSLFGF